MVYTSGKEEMLSVRHHVKASALLV